MYRHCCGGFIGAPIQTSATSEEDLKQPEEVVEDSPEDLEKSDQQKTAPKNKVHQTQPCVEDPYEDPVWGRDKHPWNPYY